MLKLQLCKLLGIDTLLHNRPVNLLRITPHRIISAIAFASMSSSILANFFNPPSFGTVSNPYGAVFVDCKLKLFAKCMNNCVLFIRAHNLGCCATSSNSIFSSVWLLLCIHWLAREIDGSNLQCCNVCNILGMH